MGYSNDMFTKIFKIIIQKKKVLIVFNDMIAVWLIIKN